MQFRQIQHACIVPTSDQLNIQHPQNCEALTNPCFRITPNSPFSFCHCSDSVIDYSRSRAALLAFSIARIRPEQSTRKYGRHASLSCLFSVNDPENVGTEETARNYTKIENFLHLNKFSIIQFDCYCFENCSSLYIFKPVFFA